VQDGVDRLDERLDIDRSRRPVHEQIGVDHLLERRTERLDELMRQAPNEATVSENDRLSARKMQASHVDRASRTAGSARGRRVVRRLSSVDLPAFV